MGSPGTHQEGLKLMSSLSCGLAKNCRMTEPKGTLESMRSNSLP